MLDVPRDAGCGCSNAGGSPNGFDVEVGADPSCLSKSIADCPGFSKFEAGVAVDAAGVAVDAAEFAGVAVGAAARVGLCDAGGAAGADLAGSACFGVVFFESEFLESALEESLAWESDLKNLKAQTDCSALKAKLAAIKVAANSR